MGTLSPLYEAKFYRTTSGREPVREWLRSLPAKDRITIGDDIRTLQFRWPLGMPLVRKMEAGLWELRSDLSQGIARVFFTFSHRTLFLLHGFVKQTARTPVEDLALARRRRQEIHSRGR